MKKGIISVLLMLIALDFFYVHIVASAGRADPSFEVDVYNTAKVCKGTTMLADNHNRGRPRILELNMKGEIVWEYNLPDHLRRYTNPGFDVELLPGNNVLFVLPGKGIYEIDREGKIVWSHLDRNVSHDADRLPNGNILVANHQQPHEAIEIDIHSEAIVWRFALPKRRVWPVRDADRLPNGNILITGTTRIVEVTPNKEIVWLLKLKSVNFRSRKEAPALGFYKAQRVIR